MFDAIALTETTVLGAVLAVVVFGGLRFIDDIVDVLVSVDDRPATEPAEDTESSRP